MGRCGKSGASVRGATVAALVLIIFASHNRPSHTHMHRLTVLSALLLPSLVAAQAPQVAPQTTDSVVAAPPTTLPLKRPPQRTTSAITTGDLMSRLYVFADDSMMGREAGTYWNEKATATRIMCVEPAVTLGEVIPVQAIPRPAAADLIIGPEGGWAVAEVAAPTILALS